MQKFYPDSMNIELTTFCPLSCPQCYCSLSAGKHIRLDTAKYWIREGTSFGVQDVMLSGGETLCYPYLFDIIETIRECKGIPYVALSGYGFNEEVLDKLLSSGVEGIFISLNGSTKEINSVSRDGYDYAINALKLLRAINHNKTWINWVMHSNNSNDFFNVIELAEHYMVSYLAVMSAKPDSSNTLLTLPSNTQMQNVGKIIGSYRGKVKIFVESCYSPMRALLKETKLFGNFNTNKDKGCAAGRNTFSVSVDGLLSPCRHLAFHENYSTIRSYWHESSILHRIREAESQKREPCASCHFSNYCRHCIAINAKLNNDLFIGYENCALYRPVKSYLLSDKDGG